VQQVRFGLGLDGERGWHARDALGSSTLGPLGFLTLLETQLGLTRLAVSQPERVVQWRAALAVSRTGLRFYERSFDADQFGTAATLLRWRDTWFEHAWQGTVPSDGPARLVDMAAVEASARGRLGPCMGERLRDVAHALATRPVQIAAIELMDPIADFSLRWRAVLEHLPGVKPPAARAIALGRPGSMLRAVQEQLLELNGGGAARKIPWRDDGSIRIVRAESSLAASEWLAAEVRRHPHADRLVVAEQASAMLDGAFMAFDQPLQGLNAPSAFRPSLQVLPLALRLVWDPLDFKALMQFLTHPVGPLTRIARARLAEKMAETPGLGGEQWQRTLAEIATLAGDRGTQVLQEIAVWLEHPRYRPNEAAPLDALLTRVGLVTDYFRKRLADPEEVRRVGALAGFHQSQSVERSLQTLIAQGEKRIGPEALDNVIAQATAAGSANLLMRPQAGAGGKVSEPGAVIEPFDEVCWWSLRAVPLVSVYPWSKSELQCLAATGAALPSIAHLLERQAIGWCRPIVNARERVTLMLPAVGDETHPLWLTLASILDQPVIERVEAVLQQADPAPGITEVPHRPLPQRRRWWQIPAGAIHGWDRSASYSSLNQFVHNPYQWALGYPAQLKASALLDLPSDSQLFGNLAHRVVERLYRQPDALDWSIDRVQSWFDGVLDGILMEEGAVLFMRGRAADRETLRQRVRRALGVLHRQLQMAGAVRVEPEKSLEAGTPLGAIRGNSDLLVTFADQRQAVVDMKWSGGGFYREKLKAQSHIQLAIYARMVEQNTSNWPVVAYFILRDPELLTSSPGIFPGVSPVLIPGSSTSQVWDRLIASWSWRRAQIEKGRIELVLDDVEGTADSLPPGNALAAEAPNERYNAFSHLAGWRADA
jgi:hypothetical protein